MRWLALSLVLLVIGCSFRPVDQEPLDVVEVEEFSEPVGGYLISPAPLYSTDAWYLSHYYQHGLPDRPVAGRESAYDSRRPQQPAPSASVQQPREDRAAVNRIRQSAAQEQRKRIRQTREAHASRTEREQRMEQMRRARQRSDAREQNEDEKEEKERRRRQLTKKRP